MALLPAWLLHIKSSCLHTRLFNYTYNTRDLVILLIHRIYVWIYISCLFDGLPMVRIIILSSMSSQHLYSTQSSSPPNRTHPMIVGPFCINQHMWIRYTLLFIKHHYTPPIFNKKSSYYPLI